MPGAGGGIVSMLLTYPLITVSSRLQVERKKAVEGEKGLKVDAIKKIVEKEGVRGLFAGVESAVFGNAITNGVYYFFFESIKGSFQKASNRKSMTTGQSMLAGAIAGAAVVLTTNPIWVINMRQTTRKNSVDEEAVGPDGVKVTASPRSPPSFIQMLTQIVKQDGIGALWQGTLPALILVINPIIQYTVFERLKARLQRLGGGRALGNLDFFLLGAISKLVATAITYPYIVIKSRMQLRQSQSDESQRYHSVLDGLRKIIKYEGVEGLYKGIEFKLVQSVLTSAFLFMAKEQFYQYAVILLALVRKR
ncbi:mitochondrial carrier domain-containing protein [Dimargaris cristalligena]|uniref:Mitochondrial carrier domain-containing protein n=1 Tax=Dimargaris cristalligena TaxID=215637 RepID=A0A4Q0A4X2_9FUNG|nr:mitochondrial carrier domain-containing protein [Dimargaris cristalligena]|eukprot:RKP40300.1 mitochondrial carrier domain-containing protein [Dimargaris cristalligena]